MNRNEVFRYQFENFLLELATDLGLTLCEATAECLLVLARHHIAIEGDKDEGLAHLNEHLEDLEVTDVTLH